MDVSSLQIVFLILAGIAGTAIAITLGWSESTEKLDPKKLVSSLIRGSIGIAIYIVGTYALASTITTWDYIEVAIFAAGFDELIKRGQGVLSK
jgi:hypothetical protein